MTTTPQTVPFLFCSCPECLLSLKELVYYDEEDRTPPGALTGFNAMLLSLNTKGN